MSDPKNPLAFPYEGRGPSHHDREPGMSLRDWFAGQALSNPALCTGAAPDYQLDAWFGKHRTGIKAHEIVAKQAGEYADAMLAIAKAAHQ